MLCFISIHSEEWRWLRDFMNVYPGIVFPKLHCTKRFCDANASEFNYYFRNLRNRYLCIIEFIVFSGSTTTAVPPPPPPPPRTRSWNIISTAAGTRGDTFGVKRRGGCTRRANEKVFYIFLAKSNNRIFKVLIFLVSLIYVIVFFDLL